MRYVYYLFLLALALVLVTVAFANRELVTLRVLPDDLERFWPVGRTVTVPLFLVIFGSIIVGVALGFVWEWLREARYRSAAAREHRENQRLAREVDRLRGASAESTDEILRLLDQGAQRR
jgi:putative membrane protein